MRRLLFSLNNDLCDCEKSKFCDPHYKNIIKGDWKIIENEKLRNLLTNGPNYRESRNINYSKAYFETD